MPTVAARVRQLREDRGFSQEALAAAAGYSALAIRNIEKGNTSPRTDTLQAIAKALGVTLSELTAEAGELAAPPPKAPAKEAAAAKEAPPDTPPRLRLVPLLGTVSAGIPISAAEVREGEVPVDPSRLQGDQGFALRVRGDSMNKAQIDDGDVVIVRMTPFVAPGDKVVALIDDEDATVKRLVDGPDGLMLRADSTTPYEPIPFDPMRVRILGKVVGAYTPSKP